MNNSVPVGFGRNRRSFRAEWVSGDVGGPRQRPWIKDRLRGPPPGSSPYGLLVPGLVLQRTDQVVCA